MQIDPIRRKKLILYSVLSLIGVLLVIGVVWYLTHSFVVVKTTTTATVSLSQNGVDTVSSRGPSPLITVAPGDYTLSVKDGDKRTVSYISLHGGQIANYNLTPKDTTAIHLLTPFSAMSLVSDGTDLNFVDTHSDSTGYITIGSQSMRSLSADHFNALSWQDTAHGFGIVSLPGSGTNETRIVAITNGQATEYPLPEGTMAASQSVAISPNRIGWFAGGKSLYKQDGAVMKKIYTADHQITVLSATNDAVLVAETIQADGDSMVVRIDRVSYDGSVTKGVLLSFHPNPNLTLSGSFSPDGSRIVVSSMGISAVYTRDFTLVATLPLQTEIANVIWKDNSTLLYTAGNQILSYSLSSHIADVVSVSEEGSTMSNLFYDKTTDSLFIAVTGTSSTDSIQRVYLTKDVAVATPEKTLTSYLPNDFSMLSCRATYSTLVQPTVIIDQRVSDNNSQNASDCIDATKLMFDQYKVDSSQFRYQTLLP